VRAWQGSASGRRELAAVRRALAWSKPGNLLLLMLHAQRDIRAVRDEMSPRELDKSS